MARFAKLFVAVGGAIASGATLMADGWSNSDWFTFVAAVLTAAGVGLVPNSE